jgi:hypothetical protein
MALFGGMFGGHGVQKNPNLDQLSLAIHNCLNLQLVPPDDEVLSTIEAMTHLDLVGFQNAHNIEGMQALLRAKSLRAIIDSSAQTLTLSVASLEEIDRELKAEQGPVKVLHVGEHRASTHNIIRPIGPIVQAIKPAAALTPTPSAAPEAEAVTVPPAFEHLEAVERLCPIVVDTFVKYGQLTTADKEVLKKIKPLDSTLEARVVALERWKAEISRRSRGIHVQQTGSSSLLAGAADSAHKSEEALMRRFDMLLHWLGKLIKALEHKGCKFQAKPVWLPH